MEKVNKDYKILIIGANSLVGSTFINYAKDLYTLFYTHHNSIPQNIEHSKRIDLLEDDTILRLIDEIKPNLVIHTVAYPNVDFCEEHQEKAHFLHVSVTEKIAQTCKSTGSKLLYFSTDAVFDGKLEQKYKESDHTNPLSYYGKTKLEAEQKIMAISKENIVLRTTVIYGPYQKSRFTNWVIDTLKQNKPVSAFTDQFNTPTLVDDICKVIIKIINLDISGVYHAAGKTCLSRYDFALKLAKLFNYNDKLIVPTLSSNIHQIAPRPQNGCLDATKLEAKLGFEFCNIDEGLNFLIQKA